MPGPIKLKKGCGFNNGGGGGDCGDLVEQATPPADTNDTWKNTEDGNLYFYSPTFSKWVSLAAYHMSFYAVNPIDGTFFDSNGRSNTPDITLSVEKPADKILLEYVTHSVDNGSLLTDSIDLNIDGTDYNMLLDATNREDVDTFHNTYLFNFNQIVTPTDGNALVRVYFQWNGSSLPGSVFSRVVFRYVEDPV